MNRLLASLFLILIPSAANAGPRPSGLLDLIAPCGWMDCPGGQCTLELVDPDYVGPANYWIEIAGDYGSKDFLVPYFSQDYIYREIGIDGRFTYTYTETHPPGTKHCVRVARTSPIGTDWSGGKKCWLTGAVRVPDMPAVTGPADGGHVYLGLDLDWSKASGACDYRVEVAHDAAMSDVVDTYSTVRKTSASITMFSDWGQRLHWRLCARNPAYQTCTAPRVLWVDTGTICPLPVVGSGIGVDGSVNHLHMCRDWAAPPSSPSGGYFLQDKSFQTEFSRVDGGHYHSGHMAGSGSIRTRVVSLSSTPLFSYDNSFDGGSDDERDAVSAHANAAQFFTTIENALGFYPKWPVGSGSCSAGAGIENVTGLTYFLDDSPCYDNSWYLNYGGDSAVQFCRAGPDGRRAAKSLDMLSHEYGHALTECASSLTNDQNFTSSLNEALSDVMQAEINRRLGRNPWLYADDSGGSVVRNMKEPWTLQHPSVVGGQYWEPFLGCSRPDGNCIHENSAVVSKMYQLLAEGGTNPETGLSVSGIGAEKAFRTLWHANWQYFQPQMDWGVAHTYHAAAAQALYGAAEAASVHQAWQAVGVPASTVSIPAPRPLPNADGCTCAADCDGNCETDLGELVTAVNIGVGSRPLLDCPDADTDGSGTVTIDDLIKAVVHALGECSVSGGGAALPSYTPSSLAPVVEVVGDWTNPGYEATVQFLLHGGQGVLAGFQFDVLYDAQKFTLDSCEPRSPLLSSAAVEWHLVAPGRIRLITLSLDGSSALPEYVAFAECTLTAAAAAACGYSPVSVSDARGAVIDGSAYTAAGVGAGVQVVGCPPTPTRTSTRTATRTATRTPTKSPTPTPTPGQPPFVWAEIPATPKAIKGGSARMVVHLWYAGSAASMVADFLSEHPMDSGVMHCSPDELLPPSIWSASVATLFADDNGLSLYRLYLTSTPPTPFGYSGPVAECTWALPNTPDALGDWYVSFYGSPNVFDTNGVDTGATHSNERLTYHVSACQIVRPSESAGGTWLVWPVVLLLWLRRRYL